MPYDALKQHDDATRTRRTRGQETKYEGGELRCESKGHCDTASQVWYALHRRNCVT